MQNKEKPVKKEQIQDPLAKSLVVCEMPIKVFYDAVDDEKKKAIAKMFISTMSIQMGLLAWLIEVGGADANSMAAIHIKRKE